MTQPMLVYIAGYGRSGSTLLDSILGSHDDAVGSGELFFLFHNLLERIDCSCGVAMPDCPFWQDVLQRVKTAVPDFDLAEAARISRATESMFGSHKYRARYVQIWNAVLQAIADVSGRNHIIDSSKSCRWATNRLPLLANDSAARVRVIHLVRDPRAIMWSSRKGKNTSLEAGTAKTSSLAMYRGLASWTMTNLSFEWTTRGRFKKSDILRLRYQDLAGEPETTLARLSEFLEMDFSVVNRQLRDQAPIDPGHGVGGNRMRRSGSIRLRVDNEWQSGLSTTARVAAQVTRPLMKRYGFI